MSSLHIVGDDFDNVNSESSIEDAGKCGIFDCHHWSVELHDRWDAYIFNYIYGWMEVVQEVHIDLKKGFHLKEFGRKLGCCSQHLHLLPMRNVKKLSHLFRICSSKSMEYMIRIYYYCLYICMH